MSGIALSLVKIVDHVRGIPPPPPGPPVRCGTAAEGYVGGYRRIWWGIRRSGGGCAIEWQRRKGERESRPDRANAESERERVNVGGEEGRARTWKGTHRGRKNETEKGREEKRERERE